MDLNTKLLNRLRKIRKKGLKVGLAHGVFDVLHVGHVNYFKEAKKYVDFLIVSVTADKFVNKGPGRPVFKINDRVFFLKNLRTIDEVIVSNYPSSENIIRLIKPDIYFKGKDYVDFKDLTNNLSKEKKLVKFLGGETKYTNTPIYSSGKIINEHFDLINEKAKPFIKKINKEKLKSNFIETFKNKFNEKILVIGDPIIDIYRYVTTSGKSNKATIISTLYKNETKFAGGSMLVANTLAQFLNNVVTLNFKNSESNSVYRSLSDKRIKQTKININLKPIKKIRYIDQYSNNKLYQVTLNEDQILSNKDESRYYSLIKKLINKFKNIIVLDYGYFSINKRLIKILNNSNKNIIINCQANSYNFGFNIFTKYKKSNIMCIDEQEFRLGVKNKTDDILYLFNKNKKLLDKYKVFIVTLGKKGCAIRFKKKNFYIPTVLKNAIDTIGCGDIFITLFSMLQISKKFDINESALISHIAAGIHANEHGNKQSINFLNLYKALDNTLK